MGSKGFKGDSFVRLGFIAAKEDRKICVQLHKMKIIVFFHDRKSLLFAKQTCFTGVARCTAIDSRLACKYDC